MSDESKSTPEAGEAPLHGLLAEYETPDALIKASERVRNAGFRDWDTSRRGLVLREEAVERCFRTASRYPMSFEYAGEVRNWLVRILLDEALEIRSRKLPRPEGDLRWTAEYWPISMQEGDPR